MHEKVKDHKCGMCDYAASRKDTLAKHKMAVHYRVKDYKCDTCQYAASRKEHLMKHKKAFHEYKRQ